MRQVYIEDGRVTEEGGRDSEHFARNPVAAGEPVMVFVACCERCVEEDDAVRVAVLGGEGEVNTYCRECADARGLTR